MEQLEVISRYTRAEALADGVLVDVSKMGAEAGYRYPVAITQHLHTELSNIPAYPSAQCEDYAGRLWDVLWMSTKTGKIDPENPAMKTFSLLLLVYGGKRNIKLWAICGPDDDLNPCITIGYPEDF